MFIFRNNTIENLFEEGTSFSGYGDITNFSKVEKEFVWFYQVPVSMDIEAVLIEVSEMLNKFKLLMSSLPIDIEITVISLENLFQIDYVETDRSLQDAIYNFNNSIIEIAKVDSRVKFIDFREFIERYSSDQWINWKYYMLSQMVINPELANDFKRWWGRKKEIIRGKRKKCLVVDLDNTLWGGIVGEDGITGIKIGSEYPGKSFAYFQQGIKILSKQGVILAICSKNNESDIKDLWKENPFLILREDDFATYQINWDNKADNLCKIAKTLNIGIDSIVFVDDNPVERELIRQKLPEVAVPEFPKRPYDLPRFFSSLVNDYFSSYCLTEEDKAKIEQYRANALRNIDQGHFRDISDFINSLDIKMEVERINDFNRSRLAQMTQKTNQFNLTTHRYTERDLIEKLSHGGEIFVLSVRDRYGDNGITGLCIVNRCESEIEIDSFLLSCRILGKRIENAFLGSILNYLYGKGIKNIKASYIPTTKNQQVKDFYDNNGFKLIKEETNGEKYYQIGLDKEINIEDLYNIEIKL